MIKRADWLAIVKDRMAILLLFITIALVIVLIATTIFRIHTSDVQVPVRFTEYGQSNIDRNQWYTQISYAIFGVIVLATNGFLALKMYPINRLLGLGFLGLGIFVLILALIVANAIFNLAPTV